MNIYYSKRWPTTVVRAKDLPQAKELILEEMRFNGLPSVDLQPFIDAPEDNIVKIDMDDEPGVVITSWS